MPPTLEVVRRIGTTAYRALVQSLLRQLLAENRSELTAKSYALTLRQPHDFLAASGMPTAPTPSPASTSALV